MSDSDIVTRKGYVISTTNPNWSRGRVNHSFAMQDFGRDLAKALGVTVEADEMGVNANAILDAGNGLKVYVRSLYGANAHRVEIGSYIPEGRSLESHQRPGLPSITVDSNRAMESIARDVSRRVIEPSRDLVHGVRKLVDARNHAMENLQAEAKRLMREFPGLEVRQQTPPGLSANLYFSLKGYYLAGTLNADGSIYIGSFSVPKEANESLFAFLADGASKA